METHALVLFAGMAIASLGAISPAGSQQTAASTPVNTAHKYTPYEQLIYRNVTQFHKSFNNRAWKRNGELVADNLHVDSNGTELNGRDAFVKRIARFVGPFPDVRIEDLVTIVDGNKAAVRFEITGTQKGDFQTPEGVIRATNRPIEIDGIEFFTFNQAGKLVDLVTVENLAELLQQIKGPK